MANITVEIPEEIMIILASRQLDVGPIDGPDARKVYEWANHILATPGIWDNSWSRKIHEKNKERGDAFKRLLEEVDAQP